MYSGLRTVSLNSFMFIYGTDVQQYGLGVSNSSGTDVAFLVGNYDLTAKFTLMIDYFSDIPYYNYVAKDDKFLYVFYTSSNNNPQVLIKIKLDFFAGLNYSGTNQTGCWYIGPICIQFCNASYSDGFVPIVKPMMLIPNLITETFFNHKSFLGFLKLIDRKIVYIYDMGLYDFNAIEFDSDTLEHSQSYIGKTLKILGLAWLNDKDLILKLIICDLYFKLIPRNKQNCLILFLAFVAFVLYLSGFIILILFSLSFTYGLLISKSQNYILIQKNVI